MAVELHVDQLSDEWFAARCGVPSASCFDRIVTSKGESSKQAQDYAYTLAGERIIGTKCEGYTNGTMQRGVEMEDEARQLFQLITGEAVRPAGIFYPDESRRFSCSPDGIIDGKEVGVEIKCPLIHTHVSYLLGGKLPTKYIHQVQGSMLVTGFKHWFFMSYYPGLAPLIVRVARDDVFIGKLSDELDKFCATVDATVERLKEAA